MSKATIPSAAKIKQIIREQQALEMERLRQESLLLHTTRAGKLLLKHKPFIVVACDEPYYLDVYRTIRKHEKAKSRWMDEDERCFQEAVSWWCDDGEWREAK